MTTGASRFRTLLPLAAALMLLGPVLGSCADMGEGMTAAFADPAKYELYDCKQLEAERKSLANREAELQGLMAKAETGFAGPVVAELAYRNDYIAVRGQSHFADEAWRRNKCHESPPAATPPPGPDAAKAALAKAGAKSANAKLGSVKATGPQPPGAAPPSKSDGSVN